jgi:hypothetical protein
VFEPTAPHTPQMNGPERMNLTRQKAQPMLSDARMPAHRWNLDTPVPTLQITGALQRVLHCRYAAMLSKAEYEPSCRTPSEDPYPTAVRQLGSLHRSCVPAADVPAK